MIPNSNACLSNRFMINFDLNSILDKFQFFQIVDHHFTFLAGNAEMVEKLADSAVDNGKNNISFVCYMLLGKLEKCLNLLIETDRIPEAAFFAR